MIHGWRFKASGRCPGHPSGFVGRYPIRCPAKVLAGVTHSTVVSKQVPKGHDGRKGIVAASETSRQVRKDLAPLRLIAGERLLAIDRGF
jgi:hypothetical protein